MNRWIPAPRTAAYLVLWLALAALIWWRTPPAAEIVIDRGAADAPLRIDLNRDSAERLSLIPGIGPALARRIVEARSQRGGFATLSDVKSVAGIPDRALEDARLWLAIDGRPIGEAK